MIDRLHEFFTRVGISPKIGDQFIGAVTLIAFNWLVYGAPLDVDGLKLAAGLLILGALGIAAPPAAHVRQTDFTRR